MYNNKKKTLLGRVTFRPCPWDEVHKNTSL